MDIEDKEFYISMGKWALGAGVCTFLATSMGCKIVMPTNEAIAVGTMTGLTVSTTWGIVGSSLNLSLKSGSTAIVVVSTILSSILGITIGIKCGQSIRSSIFKHDAAIYQHTQNQK